MELAFTAGLVAYDDLAVVVPDSRTLRLAVTENDEGEGLRIIDVRQPRIGSVVVDGDELVIELPDRATISGISFEYTIIDAQERTATATVRLVESAIAMVGRAQEIAAAEFLGQPVKETKVQNRTLIPALPPIADVFMELRLPIGSLGLLAIPSILAFVALWWSRRVRTYVAIENRDRDSRETHRTFAVRHNAERIWATGRRSIRSNRVQVETPNGRRWMDRSEVIEQARQLPRDLKSP